jgi:hypothetical protein
MRQITAMQPEIRIIQEDVIETIVAVSIVIWSIDDEVGEDDDEDDNDWSSIESIISARVWFEFNSFSIEFIS